MVIEKMKKGSDKTHSKVSLNADGGGIGEAANCRQRDLNYAPEEVTHGIPKPTEDILA